MSINHRATRWLPAKCLSINWYQSGCVPINYSHTMFGVNSTESYHPNQSSDCCTMIYCLLWIIRFSQGILHVDWCFLAIRWTICEETKNERTNEGLTLYLYIIYCTLYNDMHVKFVLSLQWVGRSRLPITFRSFEIVRIGEATLDTVAAPNKELCQKELPASQLISFKMQ